MSIVARLMSLGMLALVAAGPARANDGHYLGYGATVYPDTNTCVQLTSETVIITYGGEDKNIVDGAESVQRYDIWYVDATLNFRNLGRATTVQMGFPFGTNIIADEDSSSTDSYDPQFRTWVDDKEMPTVRKRSVPNPALYRPEADIVFVFPVQFNVGENRTVHHTYHIGGSGSVDGDTEFRYIMTTGLLWAGLVDSALVRVIIPASQAQNVDVVCPREHLSRREGDRVVLEWQWHNFKPNFDVVLERLSIPTRDLPLADLVSHADFSQAWWSGWDGGWCRDGWWQDDSGSSHDACHARWLCNRILAEYGCPFDSPFVRAQFYESGKFRPNPDFKMTSLPPDLYRFFGRLPRSRDWRLE